MPEIRDRLQSIIDELEDLLDTLESDSATLEDSGIADESAKLAIVVGHTKQRPGASSLPPIDQSEYPWNTDLARLMLEHAAKTGLNAKTFFRDNIGVRGAYKQAKDWGASLVVELHFNSFARPSANGTETLYGTTVAKPFASAIQQAMLNALGLRDRGIKDHSTGRGSSSLTALPNTPTVIIEPFFGSNPDDVATAFSRKSELSKSLVEAAQNFLRG